MSWLTAFIGDFVDKKKALWGSLYSDDQLRAFREVDDHNRYMEVGPSSSSSSISPATSGSSIAKVGLNKMGMPYFEKMEERLGIEEEEFFSKEEFDIEE